MGTCHGRIIATNHGVPVDSLEPIRPTHPQFSYIKFNSLKFNLDIWHLNLPLPTENQLTMCYRHTGFIRVLYLEEIWQFQTWELNANRSNTSGRSGCNSYHPMSSTSTAKSAGSGRCYMNINNSCWWSAREGRRGAGRGGGWKRWGWENDKEKGEVRWVNKGNERAIHHRPAESEKVEK